MADTDRELTVLGEISAHFGVRGWLRVRSFTRPPDQITDYATWILIPVDRSRTTGPTHPLTLAEPVPRWRVQDYRWQSPRLIIQLEGIRSREEARPLIGRQVCVPVSLLPCLPAGEYYWSQLIGLQVVNLQGTCLGRVDGLMETGANDVLVVKSPHRSGHDLERLVPWIPQVIRTVDLPSGSLVVDWDPDF